MSIQEPRRFSINRDGLPDLFPTQTHSAAFWEALGRAVGSFGFLEEMLGKAIFSFTATKEVAEEESGEEYARWQSTFERALSDPLGGLIDSYGKAVRSNKNATIANFDELLQDLRTASILRNVICHGSWRSPDENGQSIPLFVTKNMNIFQTEIGEEYLVELRAFTVSLICAVIDSVTHMGWQFPGSNGPGNVIFGAQHKQGA
jgi:hypothetical protein